MKKDEFNNETYKDETNSFDEYEKLNTDIYSCFESLNTDNDTDIYSPEEIHDPKEDISTTHSSKQAVDIQEASKATHTVGSIAGKVTVCTTAAVGAAVILPVILRTAPSFDLKTLDVTSTTAYYEANITNLEENYEEYSIKLTYAGQLVEEVNDIFEGFNNYTFEELTPYTYYTLMFVNNVDNTTYYSTSFYTKKENKKEELSFNYVIEDDEILVNYEVNYTKKIEENLQYYLIINNDYDQFQEIYLNEENNYSIKGIFKPSSYNTVNFILKSLNLNNKEEVIINSGALDYEESDKISRVYIDNYECTLNEKESIIIFDLKDIMVDSQTYKVFVDGENGKIELRDISQNVSSSNKKTYETNPDYNTYIEIYDQQGNVIKTKTLSFDCDFNDQITKDNIYQTQLDDGSFNYYLYIPRKDNIKYYIDYNDEDIEITDDLFTFNQSQLDQFIKFTLIEQKPKGILTSFVYLYYENTLPINFEFNNNNLSIIYDTLPSESTMIYETNGLVHTIDIPIDEINENNTYSLVVDNCEKALCQITTKYNINNPNIDKFISAGFDIEGNNYFIDTVERTVYPYITNLLSYDYAYNLAYNQLSITFDGFVQSGCKYSITINGEQEIISPDMLRNNTYLTSGQSAGIYNVKIAIVNEMDTILIEDDEFVVDVTNSMAAREIEYEFYAINPNDTALGRTYNEDGKTFNIYMDTTFNVKNNPTNADVYYEVLIGNNSFISRDRLFSVSNLKIGETHTLEYLIHAVIDNVDYIISNNATSGTIDIFNNQLYVFNIDEDLGRIEFYAIYDDGIAHVKYADGTSDDFPLEASFSQVNYIYYDKDKQIIALNIETNSLSLSEETEQAFTNANIPIAGSKICNQTKEVDYVFTLDHYIEDNEFTYINDQLLSEYTNGTFRLGVYINGEYYEYLYDNLRIHQTITIEELIDTVVYNLFYIDEQGIEQLIDSSN